MRQPTPIRHENLPLIEVANGLLLDMILADKKAKSYIVKRLSDRVALIAPGKFDAFLERLRKLGHMPKVLER
ncbi:MAG: hypothetical protein ACPGWR_04580 [Ardenticatenaceae bacterium]